MPRFYFDLHADLAVETDLVGAEFPHADAALADARRRALALVAEARASGKPSRIASIVARRQNGDVAGTIILRTPDGPAEK
ncbi:MAG: hypothetical protein Q7T73_19790 [Beijerinckiaceae bacterium]|nr:hypothetical protein [Beijerinckiaceae bacterium]